MIYELIQQLTKTSVTRYKPGGGIMHCTPSAHSFYMDESWNVQIWYIHYPWPL